MKRMLRNTMTILVGVSLLIYSCNNSKSSPPNKIVDIEEKESKIIDIPLDFNDSIWSEINFVKEDYVEQMVYATTENFTKQKIYPCPRCFSRPEVAEALKIAQRSANNKGLKLLLFDCYRPKKFQKKMFDIVQNSKYVAEPKKGGSMHNKGLAVDIALADSTGKILDFGGEFDDFSNNSHHGYSKLTPVASSNRELLKKVMTDAGFTPYKYEWWHYNYKHVEYQLDDFIWSCN